MFGTFRDKLKEKGSTYRGGAEDRVDEKTAAIHDSKVDQGYLLDHESWMLPRQVWPELPTSASLSTSR